MSLKKWVFVSCVHLQTLIQNNNTYRIVLKAHQASSNFISFSHEWICIEMKNWLHLKHQSKSCINLLIIVGSAVTFRVMDVMHHCLPHFVRLSTCTTLYNLSVVPSRLNNALKSISYHPLPFHRKNSSRYEWNICLPKSAEVLEKSRLIMHDDEIPLSPSFVKSEDWWASFANISSCWKWDLVGDINYQA